MAALIQRRRIVLPQTQEELPPPMRGILTQHEAEEAVVQPVANTTDALAPLAEAAVAAWKEANAATAKLNKAKKALVDAMNESGERHVPVATPTGGIVDVTYESGARDSIDVTVLAGLVDRETLLRIVTAAATTTEAVAGKDVALRCKRTKETEPALKFAPRK